MHSMAPSKHRRPKSPCVKVSRERENVYDGDLFRGCLHTSLPHPQSQGCCNPKKEKWGKANKTTASFLGPTSCE